MDVNVLIGVLLHQSVVADIYDQSYLKWGGIAEDTLLTRDLIANISYPEVRRLARPSSDEPMNVKVALIIIKIMSLDKQGLLVLVSVSMDWMDTRANWEKSQYFDVEKLYFLPELVWAPDFNLLNGVDKRASYILQVYKEGRFQLQRLSLMEVPCAMDFIRFPQDKHTCYLELGSLKYPSKLLHFEQYGTQDIAASQDIDYSQWKTGAGDVKTHIGTTIRYGKDYQVVNVSLTIERTTTYYDRLLVKPVLAFILVGITVFWMPMKTAQRVVYGYFVCFWLLLLLCAVFIAVPVAATTNLGKYLMVNTIVLAVSMAIQSLVDNLQHKEATKDHPMPAVLKTVFVKFLGFKLHLARGVANRMVKTQKKKKANKREPTRSSLAKVQPQQSESTRSKIIKVTPQKSEPTQSKVTADKMQTKVIAEELDVTQANQKVEQTTDVTQDWYVLASVINKLTFICYLGVIISAYFVYIPL